MTGSKEERFVSRTGDDGSTHRIPVGIVTGARAGERLTIFAGQRGTAYDGIAGSLRLFRELEPGAVRGTIVFGLVVDETGFRARAQGESPPPAVEVMMRELASGSDYLITCHGGELSDAVCPHVTVRLLGRADYDQIAMAMATAFGLPYVVLSRYQGEPPAEPTSEETLWWQWPPKTLADELRIPEIVADVGQGGSRDEEGAIYDGLRHVLIQLGFIEGKERSLWDVPLAVGERHWVTAAAAGLFYPEVAVCQNVGRGQRLGTVRDYFGNVVQVVVAPGRGKVMQLYRGMPVENDGFLLWLGDV
jgi:predicted deacylase